MATDWDTIIGIGSAICGSLIGLAFYLYFAIAMMKTAKRTNTSHGWMAFIPPLNLVLVARIGKKAWWPIFLILIPGVGQLIILVMSLYWQWFACKRRGKPGWWALILLIPGINAIWLLVMWGILAWGK